jgi:hypothetical protein
VDNESRGRPLSVGPEAIRKGAWTSPLYLRPSQNGSCGSCEKIGNEALQVLQLTGNHESTASSRVKKRETYELLLVKRGRCSNTQDAVQQSYEMVLIRALYLSPAILSSSLIVF